MDQGLNGQVNRAYAVENGSVPDLNSYEMQSQPNGIYAAEHDADGSITKDKQPNGAPRPQWGKDIEFLMSCIALSVGLGNVWRFPFTALDNGGGAFLIPYIIVLFLVGKPVYYMEMLLGQFSSRGSVKVYDFSPIMRGIGYGQAIATGIVCTYYATLMAITIRYFVASFSATLPWSYCRPEWGNACISSQSENSFVTMNGNHSTPPRSSAELYFINIILKEKDTIDDGIGVPSWTLVICLAFSWIVVGTVVIKGVQSSGKASYFLALFPYVVMIILLIRALTLPGAYEGVLFFIRPQWDRLLDPTVWYAAVTQVFFSLAICFGNIIMYSSYNRFTQNIYRDAMIVTTLDTFTSLLSGVIIFGILGNLARESGTTDIKSVVKGGAGLAFISYPDAIAKFKFLPQAFSLLFFIMLFVLGIGSNVGMTSCVSTVIIDRFTNLKHWWVTLGVALSGFFIGFVYLTPGGQFILNLVDFYGVSFVAFFLAIAELAAVSWIYGVKRLCKDVEFMLGIKTGLYWRVCWGIITPALMIAILLYTIIKLEPLTYNGVSYPNSAYAVGWCLFAIGLGQLPLWALYAVCKQPKELSLFERIAKSFKPQDDWGPTDPTLKEAYKKFIATELSQTVHGGFWHRIYDNIFG